MTDTETTEQLAAAVADHDRRLASLTQSIEAADRVSELIRLVVDAPACEARLAALRKEGREVARARLELVTEHARLADERRAFEAEYEAKRAELAEREREVVALAAELAIHQHPYRDPYGRLERLSDTCTREPDDELPSRRSDPHFGQQSATVGDDELVTERVEGTAHTLSRSVPKPRRSMRRGATAP
jgi:hypothetical protein